MATGGSGRSGWGTEDLCAAGAAVGRKITHSYNGLWEERIGQWQR